MKTALLSVLIASSALFGGVSMAQSRPALNLGTARPPLIAVCKFNDDFEQGICSGVCGAQGKAWIVARMPGLDDNGEYQPGSGDCT